MFRLFRVIIRPSNEQTKFHSALWDPVVLTIGGVIVVYVHVKRTDYSTYILRRPQMFIHPQ